MNMGNLNKLALTAQEALQQTISIASEAESSQAEPIHMLKALLESKENNLSAIVKRIGAIVAAGGGREAAPVAAPAPEPVARTLQAKAEAAAERLAAFRRGQKEEAA